MPGTVAKFVLLAAALVAVTGADAQTRHRRETREPRDVEHAAPIAPPSIDKRDSMIIAPGPFNGRAYWLALAQCGGMYFKLNVFYADAAAHARVVKPDPKATTEYTKDLKDAIRTATVYFDAAERFLMADRGIERIDAVLIYDPQSRGEGDRLKSIDSALAAARACPVLYESCQGAYPKACSEPRPTS
jgi:ferredoxin